MNKFEQLLEERFKIIEDVVDLTKIHNKAYGCFDWETFLSISANSKAYDRLIENRRQQCEYTNRDYAITIENVDTEIFDYFKNAKPEKYKRENIVITTKEEIIFEYKQLFNYYFNEAQKMDARLWTQLRKCCQEHGIDLMDVFKDEEPYRNDIRVYNILTSKEVQEIQQEANRWLAKFASLGRRLDNVYMEMLGVPEPFPF